MDSKANTPTAKATPTHTASERAHLPGMDAQPSSGEAGHASHALKRQPVPRLPVRLRQRIGLLTVWHRPAMPCQTTNGP